MTDLKVGDIVIFSPRKTDSVFEQASAELPTSGTTLVIKNMTMEEATTLMKVHILICENSWGKSYFVLESWLKPATEQQIESFKLRSKIHIK